MVTADWERTVEAYHVRRARQCADVAQLEEVCGRAVVVLEELQHILQVEGYETEILPLDETILKRCRGVRPCLLLMDFASKPYAGLPLLRSVKAEAVLGQPTVFVLTSEGDDAEMICSLELGADDCMGYPLQMNIVRARIRATLRRTDRRRAKDVAEHAAALSERAGTSGAQPISLQGMVINPDTRMVSINGTEINLTFSEFEILRLMVSNPGWVFTRAQIIDQIRGKEYAVTERAVDVQLVSLRKKMGRYGGCIQTVRGVGYRLILPNYAEAVRPLQHPFSVA